MQVQSIITAIVPLAFLSSCFGDGPVPVPPAEATILYSLPASPSDDVCRTSRYIDGVALGADGFGYISTVPYAPASECEGQFSDGPVLVERLSTSAMAVALEGGAGMITRRNRAPRVSTSDDGPRWAYNTGDTDITIDPGGMAISGLPDQASAVAGLAEDTDFIYLATWSEAGGGLDPINSPNYPCCGGFPENINGGAIRKINKSDLAVQTLAITPVFACETLDACFVSNSTDLFYAERPLETNTVTVNRFPKTGVEVNDAEVLAQVAENTGFQADIELVGLAANDTHVAWSEATTYFFTGFNEPQPPPSCKITVFTLATGESTVLLDTKNFSCAHATLDGTHVYFTIVDFDRETQRLHGVGVARVTLDGSNVESLDHGITGSLGGPRRVYLEGDTMYLVTSFAIASVKKSALDGRVEFAP